MKTAKTLGLIASVITIGLLLCSCGGAVSTVKNGHLDCYQQTTVGKVLNASFNEPTWTRGETENGTKFVDFHGKAKKDLFIRGEDGWFVIPAGGTLMAQFMLEDGGKFSLGYCEAILAINKTLPESLQKQLAENVKMQQVDLSKPRPIKNEAEIARLLSAIYGN